jgi:Bacterial PH domain
MADPSRYLLPTERVEIQIRRHWAVLAGDTVQTILLLVLGVLLARVLDSVDLAQMVAVYFCVFVVARWAWKLVDWNHEVLIVTDKRLLLLTGIFTRNVAIMPLVKVTDLTFYRSSTGLMLGYGKFIVESAGQDQALSTIDYVPKPEQLYIQISNLLFGGDKGSPGALVTQAQREAEQEADRANRRRWRRFSRRRPNGPVDERPGTSSSPSQLDAILADRDTLLADRDDPEWESFGSYPDRSEEPYRRPADPTARLPRIHEPRRGDSTGRSEVVQPEAPLPPPRRPRDDPAPGTDPADD